MLLRYFHFTITNLTKMKSFFLAIICIVIFSSTTCKKIGCAENIYSFEAKAKVVNDSDSINLGDTIWLEITCPVSQPDGNTGQIIAYKNAANLGTAIGFWGITSTVG